MNPSKKPTNEGLLGPALASMVICSVCGTGGGVIAALLTVKVVATD